MAVKAHRARIPIRLHRARATPRLTPREKEKKKKKKNNDRSRRCFQCAGAKQKTVTLNKRSLRPNVSPPSSRRRTMGSHTNDPKDEYMQERLTGGGGEGQQQEQQAGVKSATHGSGLCGVTAVNFVHRGASRPLGDIAATAAAATGPGGLGVGSPSPAAPPSAATRNRLQL